MADNDSILDDWVWVRIAMEQCLVFTFQPSLLIKAYKVKTCISSLDNATQCRSSFHLSLNGWCGNTIPFHTQKYYQCRTWAENIAAKTSSSVQHIFNLFENVLKLKGKLLLLCLAKRYVTAPASFIQIYD